MPTSFTIEKSPVCDPDVHFHMDKGLDLTNFRKLRHRLDPERDLQGDPFKMSQTSGVAPCKRRF